MWPRGLESLKPVLGPARCAAVGVHLVTQRLRGQVCSSLVPRRAAAPVRRPARGGSGLVASDQLGAARGLVALASSAKDSSVRQTASSFLGEDAGFVPERTVGSGSGRPCALPGGLSPRPQGHGVLQTHSHPTNARGPQPPRLPRGSGVQAWPAAECPGPLGEHPLRTQAPWVRVGSRAPAGRCQGAVGAASRPPPTAQARDTRGPRGGRGGVGAPQPRCPLGLQLAGPVARSFLRPGCWADRWVSRDARCAAGMMLTAPCPPPRASGSQAVRAKGHLWTPPLSPSKVRLPVVSAGALAPSSVTLSPFVVTGVSSLKQVLRPPPTCHIPRAQGQCLFWSLLLTRGLNARLRLTVLGAGPRSRRWQVRSLLRPGFRVPGWLSAGCVLTRRRDHGPLGSL